MVDVVEGAVEGMVEGVVEGRMQVSDQPQHHWLTDKSLTPHPPPPSPTRGEGELEVESWLEAPLPLWERGWGEGDRSFDSQSASTIIFKP